jgi:hypothetical protein
MAASDWEFPDRQERREASARALVGICAVIDAWIAAAESVRSTYDNLEEFDLLIAAQKKRLADLW